MTLLLANATICGLICLRILFYRRRGSVYRPLASLLAYVIAVASGSITISAAMGYSAPPTLAETVLHGVLALAILAARGNVVELFHTAEAEHTLYKIIRRTAHHA